MSHTETRLGNISLLASHVFGPLPCLSLAANLEHIMWGASGPPPAISLAFSIPLVVSVLLLHIRLGITSRTTEKFEENKREGSISEPSVNRLNAPLSHKPCAFFLLKRGPLKFAHIVITRHNLIVLTSFCD